jgi:membrane associated rhomboid family serine protease
MGVADVASGRAVHRIDLRARTPGSVALVLTVVLAHVVGAALASRHGFPRAWIGPRSEALRLWLGGSDLPRWSSQPWRLLSSGLVHVTLTHLAVNVVVLAVAGRVLEPLIGGRRLVGISALGVLAGSVVAASAGLPRVDGASGAAFALLGAGIGVGSRWPLGADDRRLLVPVFSLVAVANLAASFFAPSLALSAHTGGLTVGLLVGASLDPDHVAPGWLPFDVLATGVALVGLGLAATGG